MDRFDIEYLDVLKGNLDRAEESLRNAKPDQIDFCLNAFISAKEDYVAHRNHLHD